MGDENWKKHLLSSGSPLEFETAKALVDAGFYVGADYEYLRHDGNADREFSVDIQASFFKSSAKYFNYTIEALIECKYRSREKTILLFQDPNQEEFGGAIAGYTCLSLTSFVHFI